MRIGAASIAFDLGVPEVNIQQMGRWRSDAFFSYIRPVNASVMPGVYKLGFSLQMFGISLQGLFSIDGAGMPIHGWVWCAHLWRGQVCPGGLVCPTILLNVLPVCRFAGLQMHWYPAKLFWLFHK